MTTSTLNLIFNGTMEQLQKLPSSMYLLTKAELIEAINADVEHWEQPRFLDLDVEEFDAWLAATCDGFVQQGGYAIAEDAYLDEDEAFALRLQLEAVQAAMEDGEPLTPGEQQTKFEAMLAAVRAASFDETDIEAVRREMWAE